MQGYQTVHAFVHACIAGLLYLFIRYTPYIQNHEHADWIKGGAILLLPFLFSHSGFIANVLIESIPGISRGLRKMLSGSSFIEGDWPLVVVDPETRRPIYLGFLTIKYEKGQLVVSGDDWHPDGTHAVSFRSQQSSYENRMLQYWYAQGATARTPTMFGYTRIYFFPDHGRIERHAGEFLDKLHTSPPFFACRLRYRTLQRRPRTAEEKLEKARRFWMEIEPKIRAMPELSIQRDFA
ncbi:MAG: hypothetical protein RLZ98_2279 [Pseudomonadota bacterium]|jgi:hypothetical protein